MRFGLIGARCAVGPGIESRTPQPQIRHERLSGPKAVAGLLIDNSFGTQDVTGRTPEEGGGGGNAHPRRAQAD